MKLFQAPSTMVQQFRDGLPAMEKTSPHLRNGPARRRETLSFVLLCDDPDAPAGTWHHWAAYDIPRP